MTLHMAAIPDLLPPTTPERAAPEAPPVSSRPAPVAVPAYVPPPTLAPPPVRAPEVEAHATTAKPRAEPLFTVKVWQLGFAVIAVMLAALYALGVV